ncbi:HIT domain-containing protein [Jannaschia ovalis]|uniref:HIT domain-containing protein n=1 Tax=Jannaschia ovalis TaxID=3038773 RepID=A0ABY8LGB5_9RHOB|nr:HIT domain-containing protein [Jannaschia sp. GRR-S6-38]WGH80334.1 HIT domain-containing protein [Jannaschia sp. GRR-S6-38]
MAYDYDDDNIFARILRGEIPNATVAETEHTLAFADITPQAPVHVLVIPKGRYVTYDDFHANASDAEIVDFHRTAAAICAEQGIAADTGAGFRAITNAGRDGVQEVPHFHLHLIGGRPLGRMLARAEG